MTLPARLAHGFGRWCWAITNTMLFQGTRLSCVSSGGAPADCGGAFSFVAVNAARYVGDVTSPSCTVGFPSLAFCIPIPMHASPPLILGKSRMRKSARTDLCGGRSAMVVPTATLFALFGGRQSARTIHFIAANLLMLFLVIHVAGTILSGFGKKHALHDHGRLHSTAGATMSHLMWRRKWFAGIPAAGSLLLTCCNDSLPPTYGSLFGVGDALTFASHRLLLRAPVPAERPSTRRLPTSLARNYAGSPGSARENASGLRATTPLRLQPDP